MREGLRARLPGWPSLLAVAIGLGALATFVLAPLHGNVRYEVGVKAVSGFSAAETFTHRPLAFRLLSDPVARVADALTSGISSFEVVARLIGLGLAAGASVLLWLGLRTRGVPAPGLHATVAGAAVVLMGPESSLEPDWMAPLLALAGTGAGLAGRGRWRWPAAVLAGALFVAAAAMKLVTLPTALIGLMVLALVDRRQYLRSLVSSVVVGVLYVVATVVWAPWEIQWLVDIRSLQPDVLARLPRAPGFLLESGMRWPALVLFPAALVLAGRRERLVLVAAGLLALLPVVLQGQYWAYHGATLCVVTAVAAFRLLQRQAGRAAGIGVLAVVAAAVLLTVAGPEWRDSHSAIWATATIVATAAAIAWSLVVRRRPPEPSPWGAAVATLATLALLYPAMTPFAAQLVRWSDTGRLTVVRPGEPSEQERFAREVRRRIGEDVPVTYLAFGSWTYFIQNPTACRYPSPLFLQRTKVTTAHLGSRSYAENLECLAEPTSRWLIVDRAWFRFARTPPALQRKIRQEWRCSAGFTVDSLIVCPRARSSSTGSRR